MESITRYATWHDTGEAGHLSPAAYTLSVDLFLGRRNEKAMVASTLACLSQLELQLRLQLGVELPIIGYRVDMQESQNYSSCQTLHGQVVGKKRRATCRGNECEPTFFLVFFIIVL